LPDSRVSKRFATEFDMLILGKWDVGENRVESVFDCGVLGYQDIADCRLPILNHDQRPIGNRQSAMPQ
jgi:hypothetical protein